MADFCKQCSIKLFGHDYRELAGLTTKADDAAGLFAEALCEGCGFILVNSEGECQGGSHCLEDHKSAAPVGDSTGLKNGDGTSLGSSALSATKPVK